MSRKPLAGRLAHCPRCGGEAFQSDVDGTFLPHTTPARGGSKHRDSFYASMFDAWSSAYEPAKVCE